MDATDAAVVLERQFGDPWDTANPMSYAAILDADERAVPNASGERLLDQYGMNAEFVPVPLGGRLSTLDRLVLVGRSVFRRDPSLGLGYGMSSFVAAVNVWTGGSQGQRRRLADLLLSNQSVAVAYHELAHGNDLMRTDFTARPDGMGRLLLSGRKEVVANIERSAALVILARTSDTGTGRDHSQLLVEKSELDPLRMRYLPRFASTGMRGVQLGGMELTDCPVSELAVIGDLRRALDVSLRAFQLTRTALPAMAIGILDTALRTALLFVDSRVLYGRPAAAMPYLRQLLAEAFLDLLICDCLSTAVVRTMHLLPTESSVHAAAVKYLVPNRLSLAMYHLSQVLGAQSYIRDGRYGIFQKLARDLAPAVFGHAAAEVCLNTILPQLPRLARRSWSAPAPAPRGLFELDTALTPLDFGRLSITSTSDSLGAALPAAAEQLRAAGDRTLHRLVDVFVGEMREVQREITELRPSELSVRASAKALALPARYSTLLAAGACMNVWLHNCHRPQAFLSDPRWLTAALGRLAGDLGHGSPRVPGPLAEPLFTELHNRHNANASFDLVAMPLGRWDRCRLTPGRGV